jgi:hypothetical protein
MFSKEKDFFDESFIEDPSPETNVESIIILLKSFWEKKSLFGPVGIANPLKKLVKSLGMLFLRFSMLKHYYDYAEGFSGSFI